MLISVSFSIVFYWLMNPAFPSRVFYLCTLLAFMRFMCIFVAETAIMRLTNLVLMALKGSDRTVKEKIADALEVSISSVYRMINNNSDDLTKAASLKVIRDELGVSDEEIMEPNSEEIT